jgi:phosphatidylglycerophosphatase A
MIRAITTVFFVGLLRPAPGTWGSAVAIPLAWALHVAGGFWLLFAATIAVAALGWWAVGEATRGSVDKDPSEIVIDEVAGQWIALWPGVLTAFVAFRLFDVLKPGPVGWADRQTGPFGVMADDVIAGWLAAMVVALLAVIAHLPQVMA